MISNEIYFERRNNLIGTLSLVCLFILYSCAAKPPIEKKDFNESDLVELIKLDSSLHLDIRYATKNNFIGKPVYQEARAFLQRPAAEAVVKVNTELKKQGYGLLVFDGYRPWSVTKMFWDATAEKDKEFVANPKKGSRHNRGCAVDLTLYDLKTGKEITMTGQYDEMSERSLKNYTGGTDSQRRARDLLITTMETNGFTGLKNEWWHFDFNGWEAYKIENIPFSKIK